MDSRAKRSRATLSTAIRSRATGSRELNTGKRFKIILRKIIISSDQLYKWNMQEKGDGENDSFYIYMNSSYQRGYGEAGG